MKCISKLWLNKHKYIAVMEDCMVVVTLNDEGKEVRWAIFSRDSKEDDSRKRGVK